MSSFYVETSALLAVLLREEGCEPICEILEGEERFFSSQLTFTECWRAIARSVRSGSVTEADAATLKGQLAVIADSWNVVGLGKEILDRAAEPFPVEPVRTLDAMHLATVLKIRQAVNDLAVLSLDQRVLANMIPLGLVSGLQGAFAPG